MDKLVSISTQGEKAQNGVASGIPANDGTRPASQQSVSAIMLTPLVVLVLLMVFSAVGSALAGS
ncbi:MAG TPA: hypothetical protein VKE95_20705 [Burkholderiales bacterium]|nr:hypothetical protein [Burkholderiales bacterium]